MENRQEIIRAVLHHLYQDNTKAGSHCQYNLCYHIAWITKYRRSFLKGELAVRLKQILSQVARKYELNIIAQEVMPDHVHMLVKAQPKWSPSSAHRNPQRSLLKQNEEGVPAYHKTVYLEREHALGKGVLCLVCC